MAISTELLALFILLGSVSTVFADDSNVVVITDENFGQLREGEWMIEFYAPWCPACRSFEVHWEEFASLCKKKYPNVRVGKVDVTTEMILSGRFLVQRLPTLFHGINNDFRELSIDRSLKNMESYVRDKTWQKTEPMPWYSSPMGHVSGCLGYAMKAGSYLQKIYDHLTKEVGLPMWLVIAGGVVAVVVAGVSLGMGALYIGLKLSPPMPVHIQSPQSENFGSTGENDEPDKKPRVQTDEGQAETKPSPRPSASPRAKKETASPSATGGSARQRKGGKKLKASAD